jgi:hypothetical protein
MKSEQALDLFSNEGQGGDTYSRYRPPYHQHLIDKLTELSKGKQAYLDIAAGTGQVFLRIFENFSELAVANDLSTMQLSTLEEGLKCKSTNTPVKIICCDAFELKSHLPEGQKFDLITIAAAFHWFDEDKLLQYLKDELLKDDGVVVIAGYHFGDVSYKTDDEETNKKAAEIQKKYKDEVRNNYVHKDRIEKAIDMHKSYDFGKFFKNVKFEEWPWNWTVGIEDYKMFLKTLSHYPIYVKENKDKPDYKDPVDRLHEEMAKDIGIKEFEIDFKLTYYYYTLKKE